MIVYVININKINEEIEEKVKKILPIRFQVAKRFLSIENFKQSISSSYLLIKKIKNINESNLEYNESGKPFVKGEKNFNLSHSGKYSAIVISKNEIGVDIQKLDTKSRKSFHHFLSDNEVQYIKKGELDSFYIIWTLKEAFLKAMGTGFTPQSFNYDITPFLQHKSVKIDNKTYYAKYIKYNDYYISVCSTKNIKNIIIKEI